MRTVGFCEIEPACRFWLRQHWPDEPIFEDVRALTGEVVLERCGAVDLVAGGFPCQDISSAGKGAGIEGERSGLWFELLRIVREVRPRWVLVENVPALRTRGADVVLAGLEAEGYACWPVVVGADDAGAPHRRKRVWIVAHAARDGQPGQPESERADQQRAGASGDAGCRVGLADTERPASRDDADGCGERAVGDANESRAVAHATCRASWEAACEPSRSLGEPERQGLALGTCERGDARAECAAAQRAGDPTRERGVVARPGEQQHEWEAPRLADAYGHVGGRWSRREELLRDGPERRRDEGDGRPERHGEEDMADADVARRPRPGAGAHEGRDGSSEDRGSDGPRQPEPGVGGPTHGTARRLARTRSAARRARLRAIGNAVYPQTVEALGRAILAAESVTP